jgi:DNA polymerase-3 subunit delta'
MQSKPYSGKFKIFVIENADKLTIAAQNAMLKTMEDPAPYGIFLLLCENYNALLPTILSRAVVLNVHPLSLEEVSGFLVENHSVAEDESRIFAAYSEGSIGRALSLLNDEDFKDLRRCFLELVKKVEIGDVADVIKSAEEMAGRKERITDGLDILALHYRDALVNKALENSDSFTKDRVLKQIIKKIESIERTKKELSQNANARLALEVMLFEFINKENI